MQPRIGRNFRKVKRQWRIRFSKRPPRSPTRTRHARNVAQFDDFVALSNRKPNKSFSGCLIIGAIGAERIRIFPRTTGLSHSTIQNPSRLRSTCRPLRSHKLRKLFRQFPPLARRTPEVIPRWQDLMTSRLWYKPQSFTSFSLRQGLRHSCRKLFAQKNFRLLKGANSANRYLSLSPWNQRAHHGTYKGRQATGSVISGQGLARRTWRNTPCGPRFSNPPNLGCSFPISTLLALPCHTWPRLAWSDEMRA